MSSPRFLTAGEYERIEIGGGGFPYVDVIVDPVQLTVAPFLDANSDGPGFLVEIPTSTNTKIWPVFIRAYPLMAGWGTGISHLSIGWRNIDNSLVVIKEDMTVDHFTQYGAIVKEFFPYDTTNNNVFPDDDFSTGNPLVIWSTDGPLALPPDGVITSGLKIRIFYKEVSFSDLPPDIGNYWHITAVDQGAKTITVSADASDVTGNLSIEGSTGNDGSYTIVSATFDTDHTDIVVAEDIPDATADGWIKQ